MLIFKIVARAEWEGTDNIYDGSAHDRADGFLHFSTAAQLLETLAHHYAGQDNLLLIAVEAGALGSALHWEYSTKRGADFPHLYAGLPRDAVAWTKPLTRDAQGDFAIDLT